jgi:hypothetical protein
MLHLITSSVFYKSKRVWESSSAFVDDSDGVSPVRVLANSTRIARRESLLLRRVRLKLPAERSDWSKCHITRKLGRAFRRKMSRGIRRRATFITRVMGSRVRGNRALLRTRLGGWEIGIVVPVPTRDGSVSAVRLAPPVGYDHEDVAYKNG